MAGPDRSRGDRHHGPLLRYPPLAGALVSTLLMMLVLPNALNLPQTPPQQTVEFAPVPPTDDDPPPPDSGNVSGLGLGSSPTGPPASPVGGEGVTGQPPPPPPPLPPGGAGDRPMTKRCVGSPPRQTEDPMSPPCVGFFEGDNGGATAPGVTKNEVRVLVYLEALPVSAGIACTDEGCDSEEFYDLGKPADESNENGHDEAEAYWPHIWRVWQRYFNDRYQTYGRNVHVMVHYGRLENSPEARAADIADASERFDPFAVIADVDINGEVYAHEWASRGKLVVMTKTQRVDEIGFDADFFRTYPGHIWSYAPSMQELAISFGGLLCRQVVGRPVSFSGDGTIGQERRIGFIEAGHSNAQNRIDYAALVREQLEACGGEIVNTQYDNDDGSLYATNTENTDAHRTARMAEMRQADVTTIINMSGSPFYTRAIAQQVPQWRPEIITQYENTLAISTYEEPSVYENARNVSIWPKAETGAERPCEQAFTEVEPNEGDWAEAWPVCYSYEAGRQLFIGIQVAGPRLTVDSLDQGMHAIPSIATGDPRVPACFYRPGDYTCVKDAQVQWWDPTGTTDRTTTNGCWRSIEGGARYPAEDWPDRDIDEARDPAVDKCNIQGAYF